MDDAVKAVGCETEVSSVDVVSGKTQDLVIRRPEWVAHVLDDASGELRAVLLHLPSAERRALSDTATRIWQLVVASGEVGVRAVDLVPVLSDEYGADPTIVMRDVVALVEQMLDGEWLEAVVPAAAERQSGAGTSD